VFLPRCCTCGAASSSGFLPPRTTTALPDFAVSCAAPHCGVPLPPFHRSCRSATLDYCSYTPAVSAYRRVTADFTDRYRLVCTLRSPSPRTLFYTPGWVPTSRQFCCNTPLVRFCCVLLRVLFCGCYRLRLTLPVPFALHCVRAHIHRLFHRSYYHAACWVVYHWSPRSHVLTVLTHAFTVCVFLPPRATALRAFAYAFLPF